jgi:hypothetical protein
MRKLLVFASSLLLALPAFAVTRTWTGATSANWSEPTNWSPAGVPSESDSLVLGANGSKNLVMNNDLPAGTRIGPISIPHSFRLGGNGLVLTGPLTAQDYPAWDLDLKMDTNVTVPGDEFNGAIDVNGHSVTLSTRRPGAVVSVKGLIVGSGNLNLLGTPMKIVQPSSFNGTVDVGADCELGGSMPNANFVLDYGQLSGEGTIGSVSGIGGISPGTGSIRYGTLHTKSLAFNGDWVTDVSYSATISDRVDVTGTVSLRGRLFPVLRGFPVTPPATGQEEVIIANDGSDPVTGIFDDLPEGALISANGLTMRISYRGGDGNDVTLTNVAYGKSWTGQCSNNWSDACNWLPQSAPLPGDVLDFGTFPVSGPPPSNDLPSGFVIGGLTLNGAIIEGNPINLTGDVNCGVFGGTVGTPLILGGLAHIRCEFINSIDVNGQTLVINGPTQIGELKGSGTVLPGLFEVIRGTFTGTLSGTLALGSMPNTSIAGVTNLSTIGGDIGCQLADISIDDGGSIGPEYGTFRSAGTISATSLSLGDAYNCFFYGNTNDKIIVSGTVSLSGPLNVIVGKSGQTAGSFTIIDNRGLAPVLGEFSGLPEGGKVQAGGSTLTISYRGGDGNDVVLLAEGTSTLALTQSRTETVFGEPFVLTATVTGSGGAVTFSDGLITLGTVSPSNGIAAIGLANLPVGTHLIKATLGTAAAAATTHSVRRGATKLALINSGAPSPGLSASVSAVAPADGVPGGSVTIEVDGVRISDTILVSGAGAIAIGSIPPGRHAITTHYGGDVNFEPSEGNLELVIAPPRGRSVRH